LSIHHRFDRDLLTRIMQRFDGYAPLAVAVA